jgi:hypothetical protein
VIRKALSAFLVTAVLASSIALPQNGPPVTVRIRALADTVIAHQTGWIEVRIANSGQRPVEVPFRSDKIPGEWLFTSARGETLIAWPDQDEIEDSPKLRLGPGETLYEVLSPESCFGVMTGSGTIRAVCRVDRVHSDEAAISRRPARDGDPKSALRTAGPLHGASREGTRTTLWSLCAKGNGHFDCDEALFTVAWDRIQVAPVEATAIVDTLIARSPGSGWVRPALLELVRRLPEGTALRYLEMVLMRHPGGVAEAYAAELLRRSMHRQFPVPKG